MKRRSIAAFACVLLLVLVGFCACSPDVQQNGDSAASGNANDIASNEPVEEEIDEDQLVMKVPGAEDFAVPLDEVSVTVYGASRDDYIVEHAVERLKMMGIKHIIRKETDMPSSMVLYSASEYEPIANLIGEDLNGGGAMLIPNDGSNGWSYSTDIAVIAV